MDNPAPIRERRAVLVQGVVQGVGFRPFVYRLALEEGLSGFVGNDTGGVTIEIEGPPERVEAFLIRLRTETPPLARIDSVAVCQIPATGASAFQIIASTSAGQVSTSIPADAATCPDCLRELLDPVDRRFRYPFLNCTNCGPRFTITRRIPYDRPQTSMANFPMCPACQAEYDDPLNRRFHAQPNACPQCGPHVWLEAANASTALPSANSLTRDFRAAEANSLPLSNTLSAGYPSSPEANNTATSSHDDPVHQTIHLLFSGQIVAIKGIGGFHLAVDATNQEAVTRLRQRKHRYGKPLAVMVRDLEAARELCALTAEEEALLSTPARPIVLARRRPYSPIAPTLGAPGPDFGTRESIAEAVAPGLPWLGLFLPYTPLHHLLFADASLHVGAPSQMGAPSIPRSVRNGWDTADHINPSSLQALVMTSANLSEEPIAIDNDEARARLGQIADAFLMHNREILQRCDDSVAAIVDGAPQLLRRARGYVPLGVPLPFDAPPLLAVGGHLKNVFTLARGRFAYQSQHMGDLENLTGLDFFRESLDHLMRTFEINPQAVVHDLHPGYLSTTWAKEWAAERNLPLIAVQHHHAHIAACIAEHALTGPVIGLALDGTGYGTDGKIWGGEVLIAKPGSFDRFAHLDYVPMPGGEKAIKEPWRMAFAHLRAAGYDLESAASLSGATTQEVQLLDRMIERSVNAPQTSSLGRLFDAVAAVVLNRRAVDYEAQAAIELEGIAIDEPDDAPAYAMDFSVGDWAKHEPAHISATSLWRTLVDDLRRDLPKPHIAARFHAGVAQAFMQAAVHARVATGVNQVALSGGCMHNRSLARLLRRGLEEEGFAVYQHRAISPGDGGLSYGQIAAAAAMLSQNI
jgi:hydrogenase maturation protein HypF